jgi:hypothetical protein
MQIRESSGYAFPEIHFFVAMICGMLIVWGPEIGSDWMLVIGLGDINQSSQFFGILMVLVS